MYLLFFYFCLEFYFKRQDVFMIKMFCYFQRFDIQGWFFKIYGEKV